MKMNQIYEELNNHNFREHYLANIYSLPPRYGQNNDASLIFYNQGNYNKVMYRLRIYRSLPQRSYRESLLQSLHSKDGLEALKQELVLKPDEIDWSGGGVKITVYGGKEEKWETKIGDALFYHMHLQNDGRWPEKRSIEIRDEMRIKYDGYAWPSSNSG